MPRVAVVLHACVVGETESMTWWLAMQQVCRDPSATECVFDQIKRVV